MLNFDHKGNLKPYNLISSSVDEMEKYFVIDIESETRKSNFENYIRYATDLKKHTGGVDLTQWIDGSFVTLKPNPRDIDIVTFLSQKQLKILGSLIDNFRTEGAHSLYGVDAYIVEVYEEQSKYHNYTSADKAYWKTIFTLTRKNRAGNRHQKGFLEIIH